MTSQITESEHSATEKTYKSVSLKFAVWYLFVFFVAWTAFLILFKGRFKTEVFVLCFIIVTIPLGLTVILGTIKVYKYSNYPHLKIDDKFLTYIYYRNFRGLLEWKASWKDIKQFGLWQHGPGIQTCLYLSTNRLEKDPAWAWTTPKGLICIRDTHTNGFWDLVDEVIKRAVNAETDERTRKFIEEESIRKHAGGRNYD